MQIIRDLSLVLLSVVVLPFSLSLIILAKILTFSGVYKIENLPKARHRGRQVKVLVTGVSMAKGLFLARTMYLGGCLVIGADFEDSGIPACGRYSKACSSFYSLQPPNDPRAKQVYIDQMLEIIKMKQIDIWISCSGVATVREDAELMQLIENDGNCRCFQFNIQATLSLDDRFRFMQTTTDLGLDTPRWFSLDSREAISNVLRHAIKQDDKRPVKQYIIKNASADDKTRGTFPLLNIDEAEHMEKVLDGLNLETSQWMIQEFIPGKEEYCTQAVVIDGQVKAFLSCPSEPVVLHYGPVDSNSALEDEMLRITQLYAAAIFAKHGRLTGHLSFDFLALKTPSKQGVMSTLLPIECNPRCHTAVVRFSGREKELAAAYLSILPGFKAPAMVRPDVLRQPFKSYWIAHDLVVLYILPILRCCGGFITFLQVLDQHLEFWKLFLFGKDATFEWWDPVPFLVLNHVYWPCRILKLALIGKGWRQVNVSTGKIFAA